MTAPDIAPLPYKSSYPLIDTHTHFDEPVFSLDRVEQIERAQTAGLRHLLLIGYLRQYFSRMYNVQAQINKQAAPEATVDDYQNSDSIQAHIALGLHPFYIEAHSETDLQDLALMLSQQSDTIAIGEIGLDTYTPQMKQPEVYDKQKRFFIAQLDLAVAHGLPVLLHIRKAHADCLKILKDHDYDARKLGGIAHSFSGGEQEAKAFVKLGFKLGITGQVTNPNAKKLRRALIAAVERYGLSCLVIETDCPDMMPIIDTTSQGRQSGGPLSHSDNNLASYPQGRVAPNASDRPLRNTPANLPYVLATLSSLLEVPEAILAQQLWKNSCEALKVDWHYPKS